MNYECIIFEKRGGIATITLNRPEALNALNVKLTTEFSSAMEDISRDDAIRVLILTGAGRAFSSGGDLKAMATKLPLMENYANMTYFNKVALSIVNSDKVIISKVNGVAVGAGLSLALSADIAIASEKAKFLAPFIGVGLVPDVGLHYFLTRRVGLAKAKELIFTQTMIDAAEAVKLGLVNKVVPADQLDSSVEQLANKLAASAPKALALSKGIFNKAFEADLVSKILGLEAYSQALLMETEDHREGVQAFLSKREPKFTGK